MQVASLELCKTLWELSGWDGTKFGWTWRDLSVKRKNNRLLYDRELGSQTWHRDCPAYDLGYLLRKLPRRLPVDENLQLRRESDNLWRAGYAVLGDPYVTNENIAASPEDAAAKLCIELFKQDVLTREAA